MLVFATIGESPGVAEERRPAVARKQMAAPPEEGAPAPEFNLPAAQGGQFRLGLRTARGPVIVAFYRGVWSGECVEYFKALAEKEREINVAGATLVGVAPVEPDASREFARATGFNSYILYDYLRAATRDYGLLHNDAEHGDFARPAVFLVGGDHTVLRAWLDDRPSPDELLAEVSRVTGLPREPEEREGEEKSAKRPKKSVKSAAGEEAAGKSDAGGGKSQAGESAASEDLESREDAKEAGDTAGESPEESAPEPQSQEAGDGGERPGRDEGR